MDRLTTGKACFTYTEQLRRKGRTIGFVPTMGTLHDGHLSLIETSIKENDETIVSIYVNPTQFSEGEDFEVYPRNTRQDIKKLNQLDVSAVFTPKDKDIYGALPPENHTKISVPFLGDYGCGRSRPNFFTGITTVLYKLFQIVHPTSVYMGEKDFQQLQIVRKMVSDLKLPIEIVGCPIIRDSSGLAMSSRNEKLSEAEKAEAAKIYTTLQEAAKTATSTTSIDALTETVSAALKAIPNFSVDYVDCLSPQDLQPVTSLQKPAQLLVAGDLGSTRLIDNIRVG